MVATLWYIAVTTVLGVGQYYVERYYARGNSRHLPPTPLQRLRARAAAARSRWVTVTAADAAPVSGGDR
jgi:polar amino acid transport system permease protein